MDFVLVDGLVLVVGLVPLSWVNRLPMIGIDEPFPCIIVFVAKGP